MYDTDYCIDRKIKPPARETYTGYMIVAWRRDSPDEWR